MNAVKEGDLNALKNVINTIPVGKLPKIFSWQDENGEALLYRAVSNNHIQIVQCLLEECHLDPIIDCGCFSESLYLAAAHGNLEIVKMLVEYGAILNSTSPEDNIYSPLHAACLHNHHCVARFLVEKGENIDNSNCLIVSLIRRNDELVKYLLECGADVNHDASGSTPLIQCCQIGCVEILKMLIEKGADQCRIYEGLTALQWAALGRRNEIVSFFFDNKYCTREEVCDCYELLGVASVIRSNLHSAVRYWNKALQERSQSKLIAFKSSILPSFQRNSSQIENYDHFIGDSENAAIHGLLILERVIGIENLPLNEFFGNLLKFIGMNIEFWEAILRWTSEQHISRIFYEADQYFTLLFSTYVQSCNFKNINFSVLKLFFKFFNTSSSLFSFKAYPSPNISDTTIEIGVMSLYSIKDIVADYDIKLFQAYIESFRKSVFPSDESRFHRMINDCYSGTFSDKIIYGAFELCCKLFAPINDLDGLNETPLFSALRTEGKDKFVDILLKYGAKTDLKNIDGVSIRERAAFIGRLDICIDSPSLQNLINAQLNPNRFTWKIITLFQEEDDYEDFEYIEIPKDLPSILKNVMKFH